MRLDVFNEATELYNKYKLCEEVLEYLSDEEAVKGQKYKETLAKFAETFKSEFMMFVHERMTASGEAFENLKCCDCDKPNEENPDTPPEDAKFHIGDRVEVVKSLSSIMIGSVGTVEDYDSNTGNYGVRLDRFPSDALLQWYAEDELELYKELEEPEQPTPEQKEFAIGDKVYVNIDESALDEDDKDWYVGVIVGYEESTNIYVVDVKEDPNTTYTFNVRPDQLELYTESEWKAGNDGSASNTYTPIKGGTITNDGNG